MKNQKELIHEKSWDVLIILDACRYDYFEDTYKNYLNGDLRKVYSSGANTGEWVTKTFFKKYKDIVYISANPFINSLGFSLKEMYDWPSDWRAINRFSKVIDVWDEERIDKRVSARPKEVNKQAIVAYDVLKKKLIVHYMQPHFPFVFFQNAQNIQRSPQKRINETSNGSKVSEIQSKVSEIIEKKLRKRSILLLRLFLKLTNLFAQREKGTVGWIIQNHGIEGVERFYKKNLKHILYWVKKLTKSIEGNIVLTADHGQLLGETNDNRIGHGPWGNENPLLRTVPWLEVME